MFAKDAIGVTGKWGAAWLSDISGTSITEGLPVQIIVSKLIPIMEQFMLGFIKSINIKIIKFITKQK